MVKSMDGEDFFEFLWDSAKRLRGALEPSEYKHPVLGLLFLKYVSDSYMEMECKLKEWTSDPSNEDYYEDNEEARKRIISDRDEYVAENVFWVPEYARWEYIVANAKDPNIAKILDDAMGDIEKENPKVKNLLYRNFSNLRIPATKFGELIELFCRIGFNRKDHSSADILGQAYEYFLGKFALAEGKGAGAFYSVGSIVKVIVGTLAPKKGKLYEPAIGSGGMVAWSEKFMESHGGKRGDISIYGQEYTHTTWKLAAMNLIIRGLDFDLGSTNADTLLNDLHKDLRADYVMANPPFNQSKWGADQVVDDVRWKYGNPSDGNANYAWIQHIIHHMNSKGKAGIVMANGAMTSINNNEDVIRRGIIEDDLVECMVALPPKLFINTQIPSCIFFLNKEKKHKGKTLFIDARKLGRLESSAQLVFDEEDIYKIADTYHAWAETGETNKSYECVAGFCKVADVAEIAKQGFNLSPGRYVGAVDVEDDDVEFEKDMALLIDNLSKQTKKSVKLDSKIFVYLKEVGYGVD